MALFAAPIAASLLAYRFAHPVPTANHGELLLPPAQAPVAAARARGRRRVLVRRAARTLGAGRGGLGCLPEACQRKLYLVRQVRLAMGRNAERIARVFVADDGKAPDAAALAPYAGTEVVLRPPEAAPAPILRDRSHVYLVDPHGNVMMRWDASRGRRRA